MKQARVTLQELLEQLSAEASAVSASGLDGARRAQLEAIRERIRAMRLAIGLTDS